jgi:hypothetical protein
MMKQEEEAKNIWEKWRTRIRERTEEKERRTMKGRRLAFDLLDGLNLKEHK